MPIARLRGLKGLGSLSPEERQQFMSANAAKLGVYRNPRQRERAADVLYMNQKFINTFGKQAFDKMNDGTQESYDTRNSMLREKVVNDAFTQEYSPFVIHNGKRQRNNNRGLGVDWEKYNNQMSTDAKEQLLNSDFKSLQQMNADKKDRTSTWYGKAIDFVAGEAIDQYKKDSNAKILNNIFNDDTDKEAKKLGASVSDTYFNSNISTMSDSQVKNAFIKAITPSGNNLGISEYASHYGNGTNVSSEMEDFSVDDMRQVLAKKATYDKYMSPDRAATALNNDAKRYIKEHQGSLKRAGLFLKDVGISALSYSADKVNGIYELGLLAADRAGGKVNVLVDDAGNVVDTQKSSISRDNLGRMIYRGKDGKNHFIHQEQVDRTTLHQMGKNTDGSDEGKLLNQQYWTRAEQFGTLDEDEQKQYEKLGSSPYKVAYNPNEDTDLWYEAFKMSSFGLADAASMLIPFGVGTAGKVLSTASKAGEVARGLGKGMQIAGRYLGAESRVGQLAQGTAGALGIANAYQRGAFQETLQKNLANAEETVFTASRNDIYNQYNSDKEYKANVDRLIAAEATKQKAAYIAQAKSEGMQIADEKAIDKLVTARAQEAVLGNLVQQRVAERKGSQEYADLQQRAIQGAGDAATATFLPEAVKYGFVNTMGFRKYLYTNPAGVAKKVSSSLKGLKEVTTTGGLKRLGTETSKFLTRGQKLKEFGKTLGSQAWGGAWTNGTDDMQVDAAERINDDSFNRYLHQYQNGEAMADTYGFADGLFSYMKGLSNSMGQETTWNAATVGGLGSIVNFTPNFANIVHLATKEGREAYKNNFWRTPEREESSNGEVKYKRYAEDDNKGHKKGDIIYSDNENGRFSNLGGQINYFLQNGVLNTYYGKKQAEKDVQQHADYVNNLLDSYDDFKGIESLVASDIAIQNAGNLGDQKTAAFVKAINAVNMLDRLSKNKNDATTMSSVVDNARNLIEKVSQLSNENGENPFSEEEISNLLSQYYANNPGVEQSEENNQKALYTIAQNAQKLKEASEAFDKAEEEIQKIEKNTGTTIDSSVRFAMKTQQALNGHWQERLQKMKDEIGDASSEALPQDNSTIIATVGGKKNAQALVKVYDKQRGEIEKQLEEQKKKTESLHGDVVKATIGYDDADEKNDSDARLAAQKKLDDATAKEEASKQQEKYLEDLITATSEKKSKIESSVKSVDESSEDKVLTADEIFALDPVTRARMMSEDNRDLYSKEQQIEIEKLEQQLIMKDADALQKIQDISLLTQRVNANRDAYSRMAKNPQAAAVEIENQREMAADAAYKLINQRNAETIADLVNQVDEGTKGYSDVSSDAKNEFVFNLLKRYNSNLLDIIDNDKLLPQYQKQVQDAKAFRDMTDDITAIVSHADKDDVWKNNIADALDNVINTSSDRDNLMANLEKVIDDVTDNPQVVDDFEYVLKGLEKLGYQRDATVVENRQQRKQREEGERKKREEEKKKVEAEASAAAVKAAEEKRKAEIKPIGELESVDLGEKESEGKASEAVTEKKVVKKPDGWKMLEDYIGEGNLPNGSTLWNFSDHIRLEDSINYLNSLGTPEARRCLEQLDLVMKDKGYTKGVSAYLETDQEASSAKAEEKVAETVTKSAVAQPEVTDKEDSEKNILQDFIVLSAKEFNEKYKDSEILGKQSIGFSTNANGSTSTRAIKIVDDVKLNNIIGNLITSLNPDLTVFSDSMNTGGSLYGGGMKLLLVKDADGIEHGSPVNLLRSALNDNEKSLGILKANNVEELKQKITDIANNSEKSSTFAETNDEAKVGNTEETKAENAHIVDNGETVYAESPSVEEQAEDTKANGNEAVVTEADSSSDPAVVNAQGEQSINTNTTTLSGNAMTMYESKPLAQDGKLVKKVGAKEGDTRNSYNAWMKSAGIKLDNIINQELGQIIRRNPNAAIKFMCVKPDKNATNDVAMQTHLMLVLDYDNSINKGITSIHNRDNGGVIESNGKKYLVVGVVGYGNRNADKLALYDMLWNPYKEGGHNLKKQRIEFFDAHPTERFYVNEKLSTEIVPNSLIPGYIVRQLETDESPEYRSISELLKPENGRNPFGFDLQSLSWMIQELTKILPIGVSGDMIMKPRDVYGNSGNAFVLIPASNGKMVPAYLKPLMYNEMKDGSLKDKVNRYIEEIMSPNYDKRYQAMLNLINIFHFNKDGDDILLGKDNTPRANQVSLLHDGKVFKTFVLNSDFDRSEFYKAMADMNPRVNITASVLRDPIRLKEYDEAGALMTDAALLNTAGSSYSIYGLDGEGNMIKPQVVENSTTKTSNNSDFKSNNRHQVPFNHNYYIEDGGVYYLNGVPVTDEATIKQLDYNRQIQNSMLSPVKDKGVWNYYILNSGEHPKAIMENRNTHEIKELSEEDSAELVKQIAEEKAQKEREANAKKSLEERAAESDGRVITNVLDTEGRPVIDPETGEPIVYSPSEEAEETVAEIDGTVAVEAKEAPQQANAEETTKQGNSAYQSVESPDSPEHKASTQTFKEVFGKANSKMKLRISKAIKAKWADAPKNMSELEKFLRDKDVEVDAIGTSEADIESWIKTLEDCR